MKLYHGTSFENACQILSKELWRPLLFDLDLSMEHILNDKYAKSYTLEKAAKMSAIWFTTNPKRAESYACVHQRPAILWWECEDAKTSGDYSFRYDDPVPTEKVKALIGISAEIMFYGNLINAIFNKEYSRKYIIKSTLGGIMTADSRKAMKRFLETTINEIESL